MLLCGLIYYLYTVYSLYKLFILRLLLNIQRFLHGFVDILVLVRLDHEAGN